MSIERWRAASIVRSDSNCPPEPWDARSSWCREIERHCRRWRGVFQRGGFAMLDSRRRDDTGKGAHPVLKEKLDPREQHFLIPSSRDGLALFLRHLPAYANDTGATKVVLYIHGGTFPSGLSVAHRFDGHSWRDALCMAGFHVWGFDFHGFGFSDPYPEMNAPPDANPSLCRAEDASRQVAAAVRFILDHHRVQRLSIIAHS